jgi:hypothetical protein
MSEPGVEIAWPALKRAWRKAEYEELWLQFRPSGGDDAIEDVVAAIEAANRRVDDAGWGEEVFAGSDSVSGADAGPVALMSRAGPEPGVRAWFAAFAGHLERLGRDGRVVGAPQNHFPMWLSGDPELPLQLAAFKGYRTVDPEQVDEQTRQAAWFVPADLTHRIAEAAQAWGHFPGADVYLRSNLHQMRLRDPDQAGPLAQAALRFGMSGLTYLTSRPRRLTSTEFGFHGLVCHSVLDDALTWRERLDSLTEAMIAVTEDLELALVRHSTWHVGSWDLLEAAHLRLPYVPAYQIRYNRHLIKEYVPDVSGVQVLTDAHLAHARDLTDWVVEPLGGGRHLVQAKALSRWYATIDPDPETLTKARQDFGTMILTPQTIAENPAPPGK